MVIKRLKNGSFFVFSADDGKKWVTIWENYLSASESSDLALPENVMKKNKKEKRKYPPKKKKKESMNRIKGIIINIWTHFEAEEEEKKERN